MHHPHAPLTQLQKILMGLGMAVVAAGVILAEVAAGGIGGAGTQGVVTHQAWSVFSPSPCPAASVLSVSAQSPYLYAACSDGKLYQYVR